MKKTCTKNKSWLWFYAIMGITVLVGALVVASLPGDAQARAEARFRDRNEKYAVQGIYADLANRGFSVQQWQVDRVVSRNDSEFDATRYLVWGMIKAHDQWVSFSTEQLVPDDSPGEIISMVRRVAGEVTWDIEAIGRLEEILRERRIESG